MNRSQSWRKIPSEERGSIGEDQRSISHPNLNATLGSTELGGHSFKSSLEDLRRKVVRLNKELDEERIYIKQLRREKSVDVRHAREEEQRRAASHQTELKSKLHKDKSCELATLKEQINKEKEKEILQIIKQKDDAFRSAQQAWLKEKEELRVRIRAELWNDAKEESKKEFDRERTRLEQEILDLQMQRKEGEEALKVVQESDKRKVEEIRRLLHDHEIDMEKFKRNSWQESRRQMSEIRQLLNIIEQLERKLGLDSGNINKLRMEKEGLYDELRRKTNSFDVWDNMVSNMKSDSDATTPDPRYGTPNQELRILQRKNVELSSLVKKLDEKNQQLATRNTELLSDLERSEKDARDKNKKLEKKNLELTQNAKKLESRNKSLLDDINSLKKKGGSASGKDVLGKKDKSVRSRGQAASESTDLTGLKEQIKDQAKTIEELKQNLLEKERRIDLLKERKRNGKKPKLGRSATDTTGLQTPDQDDSASVVSDLSDLSEMSSNDSNSDANKLKKLAKELLALERAYAILQAQVGSTVDVEREELERQQLQSDLIESQARIHELERMMDSNLQGGTEELQQLQHDNQDLYQKLVAAEVERDQAQSEVSKNSEDLKDLQDKKDLLEFELEEMSQLSFAGSEEESTPRTLRDKEDRKMPLSLEEVKACLEDLETEKSNTLSGVHMDALRQARSTLTALPQKISHLEATEAVLRSKVKDLEERKVPTYRQYESHMVEQDRYSDTTEMERLETEAQAVSTDPNDTDFTINDINYHFRARQLEDKYCETVLTSVELRDMEKIYENFLRDSHVGKELRNQNTNTDKIIVDKVDAEAMTDFVWADIIEVEETYQEFLENMASLQGLNLTNTKPKMVETETATDFSYHDIVTLENIGRQLEELQETALKSSVVEVCERESNTDVIEKHEVECNTDHVEKTEVETLTDLTWVEMDLESENQTALLHRVEEMEKKLVAHIVEKNEAEVMTELTWEGISEQEYQYKEQIDHLQTLLTKEKEMREADQKKLQEYELKWEGISKQEHQYREQLDHLQTLLTKEKETREADQKKLQEYEYKWEGISKQEHQYREQLDHLQTLLTKEKESSETDQQKMQEYEVLYQELVGRLTVEVQNKIARGIVERAITDALARVANETVSKTIQYNMDEIENMRVALKEKEQALLELQNQLFEINFDKKAMIKQEQLHCEQISDLYEQLKIEQELRESFEDKIRELETLNKTSSLHEKAARAIVEKAISNALTALANATIESLQEQLSLKQDLKESFEEKIRELETLRKTLPIHEKAAREIVEKAISNALTALANATINSLREQLKAEQELSEGKVDEYETVQQQYLQLKETEEREKVAQKIVEKVLSSAVSVLANATIESLRVQLISEEELRESCEWRIDKYETLHHKVSQEQQSLLQEKVAQTIVMKAVSNALIAVANTTITQLTEEAKGEDVLQKQSLKFHSLVHEIVAQKLVMRVIIDALTKVAKEAINDLQQQMLLEKDKREAEKMKLMTTTCETDEVEVMTDLRWEDIDDLENNQLMKSAQHIQTQQYQVERCDVELMTDMTWTEVLEVEEKYQEFRENILEIQDKLAKVDVEKCDVAVLTDFTWNEMLGREQMFKQVIEDLKDQLALEKEKEDVEKCDVEILTECTWEEMLGREQMFKQVIEDLKDQLALKKEKEDVEKCDVEILTECTWEEMLGREQMFKQVIEDLKDQMALEKVEKCDVEILTECTWEEMLGREQMFKQVIEDLKDQLALEKEKEDVEKCDVEILTECTWEEMLGREQMFKQVIEDLKDQMALEKVEKCDVEILTECTWEEMLGREQMFKQVIEDLKDQLALEKEKEDVEKCDVEILTECTWEEMLGREQMFKQVIEDLKDQMALEKVEKCDVEILTECTWEEMLGREQMFKQVIEDLKDQLALEKEKEDVEKCDVEILTECTWEEMLGREQMFKQVIEDLKDQLALKKEKEDVEKCDVEILTECTWEEMLGREQMFKQVIEDLKDQMALEKVEKCDVEILTECTWEEMLGREQMFKQVIEDLKDQLALEKEKEDVEKCDVEILTECTWEEMLGREQMFKQVIEDLKDQMALEKEKEDVEKCDVEILTECTWEEMLGREQMFKQVIEDLKDQLALEKEKEDVEKCDVEILTDCTWNEMLGREQMFKQVIEDLKNQMALEKEDVEKCDVEILTECTWEEMLGREQMFKQVIEDLKHQLALEKEKFETEKIRLEDYEALIQEHLSRICEDKSLMTEDVWIQVPSEMLETTVQRIVQSTKHQAIVELASEAIVDLQQLATRTKGSEQADKETLTDMTEEDIDLLVNSCHENSMEIANWRAALEEKEQKVNELENELKEMRLEKKVMVVDTLSQKEQLKETKEVMTEFSWKEIEYLEKTYREWVEELRQMKEDLQRQATEKEDKNCMTESQSSTDAEVMTDLHMEELAHLEKSYHLEDVQLSKDNKVDQGAMTDLLWDDIVYLETTYTQKLEELEAIAGSIRASDEREMAEKETMTDLSWEDVLSLEVSYKEELHKVEILEQSFHHQDKELRDEESMTDLNWDEVECQSNTYKNQLDLLKEMMEVQKDQVSIEPIHLREAQDVQQSCMDELGWEFGLVAVEDDVEIDDDILEESYYDTRKDAESNTDLSWKDLLPMDKIAKFEDVDKCCSTDLTWNCRIHVDISAAQEKCDQECSTDLCWDDLSHMEDIYWQEIQRLEELRDEQSKLVDKQCMTDSLVEIPTDRVDAVCMTELSSCDIESLVQHGEQEQNAIDYKSFKTTKNAVVDMEPSNSRGSTTMDYSFDESLEDTENGDINDQQTSTDITLDDIAYFEDLEIKHHELAMVAKQGGLSVDKNGKVIKTNQETATDITLDDMLYYEQLELESEERMSEDEQQQSQMPRYEGKNIALTSSGNLLEHTPRGIVFGEAQRMLLDKESLTELTLDDIEHLENVEVDHEELLLEKEQWADSLSGIDTSTQHALRLDQQTETDFTINELNYYENLELEYNELKLENEHYRDLLARMADDKDVDKDVTDQGASTELTWDDMEYYENLELEYNELKVESEQQILLLIDQMNTNQQAQEELKFSRKNVEIETLLTMADLVRLEEVEATHQECTDRQTKRVERGVGTEVTMGHLQYLEKIESETKNKACGDVCIGTDLTLDHLQYLEKIESETKNKASSDVCIGTDLTLNHLQYLEKIESETKNKASSDVCIGTDLTLDHVQYLEKIESETKNKACSDVCIGTDLTLAEIHYLEEIDIVHTEYCMTMDNDTSSRTESSEKESKGVSTELTAPVLEYLEEVANTHEEIVREYEAFRRSVTKEQDDVGIMTEMTGEHLEYLDEMALKSEELETMLIDVTEEAKIKQYEYDGRKKISSKDCQLMTELSVYDLTNLESELSSLRQQERQSRRSSKLSRSGYECLLDIDSKGSKRRHDIALMTELTIDNLKTLENSDNIYTDLKERGLLSKIEDLSKPTEEHSVITDLRGGNIDHLEQIENLYNEDKKRQDDVKDKQSETDMTQSELTRLENLANKNQASIELQEQITAQTTDAVFGSCPRERRGQGGRYGDGGRHGDAGRLGDKGHHGDEGVDVGIQCELKDILSLIEEQHLEHDSPFYVSALKINRDHKEGYDPVEVILKSGRQSSTPDVSTRNHDNNQVNTSLSMDYGWQSSTSLDSSGFDKTPVKDSSISRWDSPQVPLAQDEIFDLSDIESVPSEESLVSPLRKESAVVKFDRYVMARKESEMDLVTNLRETGDHVDGPNKTPKGTAEVLKENEQLKTRILHLEFQLRQKGDLSEEELELLKQKIQQLQEAEQQIDQLSESNAALKDRLNLLQDDTLASGASTSRSSEGRTRLLLVQDWGLDDTDLESLFSAREGAVSPAESLETSALRRLLDEYVKADHGTQAGPGPGVSQEIQTTGDLLKLIDLSYDGTIPDHIAKELEKLKTENKELYQELLQLRRQKLKNSKSRTSDGENIPRDLEEPITSIVQIPSESKLHWMTKLGVSHDEKNVRQQPPQPVKDIDELLFKDLEPRPKQGQYTQSEIQEPEIKSARSPRDPRADIDRGLLDLMGDQDSRYRTDTVDILDFHLGDVAPPDFSPPPIPSEPPPDNDPMDIDTAMEGIFGSSPPRDSKALRATSRQKSQLGRPAISESFIQPDEDFTVEGQPDFPGQTDIPPALRISRTPVQTKPGMARHPFTTRAAPPPTLPKPPKTGPGSRRVQATPMPGLLATPLARSRESMTDEEAVGLTPRGYVRATASAINQGEIDALSEKINFLEKQLKNKEGVIRSMKTEATEQENKALVERKDREIKILEEDVAFLKQENQKKERDLLAKVGEINRKNYEVDQWKGEATNNEKQRKRIETSYMNLQGQTRNLQGSNVKLTDLQSKHSTLEKENKKLSDKVTKLEKTEKEFKQLEYNITVLQKHLQDMESVEKERDDLSCRLKTVENQRDDLLKKGRMVETERNDFLRNNKIMEMQRDELEQRYAMAHEELMQLKSKAGDLQYSVKEAQNNSLDVQHERNYVQTQYKKLEGEKIELQQELNAITRERNSLETRLAELEDSQREYLKLEDGFHTLRLKVAELTSERDGFETQLPTLKVKVTLLKKACKEKDDFIDKLNDEVRDLRHAIATSTLDDLSKIKSYGYSPENFVKYSGRRDRKTQDVVDAKTPDTKSSRRKNQFPRKCVALFDYNPQTASVTGRPEKQLTLKEGDQLTLLSDMSNGCYEAELNGVRGLVPVLYVEELDEGLAAMPNGTDHVTKAKTPVSNGNHEVEGITNGRHMSPRPTTTDLDLHKQCFVALFNYNPYQSCTTGRPELELPFKEGDIMTVYGDVDANGYYKAEMEGETGLVPSNFVEEVSSSTFLQPTSTSRNTTVPQQILSMYDNIQVPSPHRPVPRLNLPLSMPTPELLSTRSPTIGIVPSSHVVPPLFASNPISTSMAPLSQGGQPSGHMGHPLNHMGQPIISTNPVSPGVMPSNHVVQPVATTTPRRDQPVQPIFNPHMTPAEVQKLAAPVTSPKKSTSQRSPRKQTVTSKRLPSQPLTSPPRITSQMQKNSAQPVNKPQPRQSKALVSRPQSVGSRGVPNPPSNLHVLRPVNHDAILLGWDLPEMDEFGRSNGAVVKGYKIYENSEHKMDVRSQFMAKALVDELDLRYPIQFTICTMGEGGTLSSEVSTTFTDTISNSRMSISTAIEGTVGSMDQWRTFVALYDYDPVNSSPNENPQYELYFNEGDILRIEDMSRKDGFYFGSLNGKKGLIPSNFIEEVAVATARGPSSPSRKHNGTSSRPSSSLAITNGTSPSPRSHKKKMVALYDYSPNAQSPLTHSELSFKKGQTIIVVGPMTKDGFYSAVVDGRKGLVPASFLE